MGVWRDRQALLWVVYCEPLCIPSILFTILWRPPGGVPGDCSHGIPTLYERVSFSDWFRLPPAGACIRPVVIWIWIIDDASPVSLSFVCVRLFSLPVWLSLCPLADSWRERETGGVEKEQESYQCAG